MCQALDEPQNMRVQLLFFNYLLIIKGLCSCLAALCRADSFSGGVYRRSIAIRVIGSVHLAGISGGRRRSVQAGKTQEIQVEGALESDSLPRIRIREAQGLGPQSHGSPEVVG